MKFKHRVDAGVIVPCSNSSRSIRPGTLTAIAAVLANGLFASVASAQTPAPEAAAPADSDAAVLDNVKVTGTLLRRADYETSSPVTVIDRKQIESSGVATLGQLLQRMPTIAGAATNPQVNNTGGDGTSTISLRGLGEDRTLLLLDGRRIVTQDVNSIPINMIERVEILKDGASSTYGSDAIGGVVNFISRTEFSGVEITGQYGISAEDDADQVVSTITWGVGGPKGRIVAGLSYEDRKQVGAGDRSYSDTARYLYGGMEVLGGSPTTPFGSYRVPKATATALGLPDCSALGGNGNASSFDYARSAGTDGSDPANFRCYVPLGNPGSDSFNFQPDNLNLTPQTRFSGFFKSTYNIVDNVDFFASAIYHRTESKYQLAPEPLATDSRGVIISADSVYNPFGVDIARARLRLSGVGPRQEEFITDRVQLSTGLTGKILDRFDWEAYGTYGAERQNTNAVGELFVQALGAALGPSFDRDPAPGIQDPVCGTPEAVIEGCVPFNIFGVPTGPFGQLVPNVQDEVTYDLRSWHAQIGGPIFTLPAGPVGLAVGYEYRTEQTKDQPDFLRQAALISGNGRGVSQGEFTVDELFAELAVPLLADKPFAKSLNLSLGVRYSDYSTFGDTTNTKIGLEYRPINSLLVRATRAEVFRSPTILDLFQSQADSALSYDDPCNNLTTAVGADANVDLACQNVARDGSFSQEGSQIIIGGIEGGNPEVKPESGDTTTVGFVFSPEAYTPLSVSVDYWKFELEDTIAVVGANNLLTQCFNSGVFCDSFSRDDTGQLTSLVQIPRNVGSLTTDGIDAGIYLNFPAQPWGKVSASLDWTYLIKFDNTAIAGDPSTKIVNAGKFNELANGGDGTYPRNKAQTRVGYEYGDIFLQWATRYFASVKENPGDPFCNVPVEDTPFGIPGTCEFKLDAVWYHDLLASYTYQPANTEVSIGVDNVTDEQPPISYSGFANNYDARTYDAIGRFFYGRVKVNF